MDTLMRAATSARVSSYAMVLSFLRAVARSTLSRCCIRSLEPAYIIYSIPTMSIGAVHLPQGSVRLHAKKRGVFGVASSPNVS